MILESIVTKVRKRIERDKKIKSLAEIKSEALSLADNKKFSLEKAISSSNMNFICEVKKASPSKGVIVTDFSYIQIAKDYERAGASAISVLTEEDFFLGKDEYLQKITKVVNIPVLRKDFIIDEYQIYQSKVLGASAILLICAILDDDKLKRFYDLAYSLGLSCLVETHNKLEIKRALNIGAKIIGINNRDLQTFKVDINNSLNLRNLVPDDVILVSESGISTAEDIKRLRQHKISAVLVGETLMKAKNKIEMLNCLTNRVNRPKVKICGIKSLADVNIANKFQPDYIGFVFAPSKRQITIATAKQLDKSLNKQIKRVGVFANNSFEEIKHIVKNININVIQLHGDEDNEFISKLRTLNLPIWQAIKVQSSEDLSVAKNSQADMILFDAYNQKSFGGTGKCFNWNLIKEFDDNFVLAGGLNEQNIIRAIRTVKPYIVDISSGVENQYGKDDVKVKALLEVVRKVG